VGAHAEALVAQRFSHEFEAAGHLVALAGNPGGAFRGGRALAFEQGGDGGVAQAVGQGFPALDLGPLAVGRGNSLLFGVTLSMYSTMTRESNSGVSSSRTSTGILPSGLMSGTLLSAAQGESITKSYSIFFRPARHALCAQRAGMGADQLHRMLSGLGTSIIAYGQRFFGQVKSRLTEKDDSMTFNP
jgi:hypothetical protein